MIARYLTGFVGFACLTTQANAQMTPTQRTFCNEFNTIYEAAPSGFNSLKGSVNRTSGEVKYYASTLRLFGFESCQIRESAGSIIQFANLTCVWSLPRDTFSEAEVDRFSALENVIELCLHEANIRHVQYENDYQAKLKNNYRHGAVVEWDMGYERSTEAWDLHELKLEYHERYSDRVRIDFVARKYAR